MKSIEPEDRPIPKEAPRAPTQEEWDAMTPGEREAAVDALVCSVSQEEQDEAEAMAEGDEHYEAKEEIRGTLRTFFEQLGRRGARGGGDLPGRLMGPPRDLV
jgi:hypothetical protein